MKEKEVLLAQYFIQQITNKPLNDTRLNYAIEGVSELIQKGWTIEAIKSELDGFKKDHPTIVENVYHLSEIMGNKVPPNNLLVSGSFYYHSSLRKISGPPRLVFDKEERKYIRIEEEFFLEMKAIFTVEDLLEYWHESSRIVPNEHNIKQDKGKFEYLLRFYDIENILFMIDLCKSDRERRKLPPVKNAFLIEQYNEKAEEIIKAKKNIHQLQGINRIIPKKEVSEGVESSGWSQTM